MLNSRQAITAMTTMSIRLLTCMAMAARLSMQIAVKKREQKSENLY